MSENFDVIKIRRDFPILDSEVRGKKLVYLDNAATTQKPLAVVDALNDYYKKFNSNIHRGVHFLSREATRMYDDARRIIQKFLNARREEEIIFLRGATEAINLIAQTFGRQRLGQDDEVLISAMEHHANIVPWQILCEQTGAKLKVAPIDDDGEIILEEYEKAFSDKTKLVSVVHVSNSLGTVNPIKKLIDIAREKGVPIIVDGAQSIQHAPVDVQELDCDFFVFSGHKIYGPTGVGALYGKLEHLESMPPYHGGGDMILSVSFEKTTFNEVPFKFEAGTPNIAGAIGLGEAIKYLQNIGIDAIAAHEKKLLDYATDLVRDIEGLRIIGTAKEKSSALSFVLDAAHPHDIGTFLDMDGVAVRTGHHCTEPVMRRFEIPATTRASFAMYNTTEEAEILADSIKKVVKTFS